MTYLILISSIQLLGILLLLFLKSYSSKKGENQAIKEDIGKITEIVEGIKKDLADNTEKLKSDLALKSEHLISLRVFERDSLINYYKELYGLLNSALRIDPTIFTLDNYSDIDKIKVDIDNAYYNYNLAEANVELFYSGKSFLEAKYSLKELIIKFKTKIAVRFIKFKGLFVKASIEIQFKPENKSDINQQLNNETILFMQDYYKERNELYDEIHIKTLQIKEIIRKRLVELIDINS